MFSAAAWLPLQKKNVYYKQNCVIFVWRIDEVGYAEYQTDVSTKLCIFNGLILAI